ncbi:hypothetical protein E4U42_002418 [Claviceps africana]|uniref:THUMP domain-containing protein n=1 Tax=Claviceps africana TaxID=83212 RepID=A0A8K0J9F7_9HYPO|nr:hypothetical protein E4U42_002418 [Claviceps africana]
MADAASQKRKQGPSKSDAVTSYKRSKGGSAGRWKTPHHRDKMVDKVELGATFHVGDRGIWVTFARGMRERAIREFKILCDEYGKIMYSIDAPGSGSRHVLREKDEDIEAAIEAELSDMKSQEKTKTRQVFTPVSTGIECLFFMKTMEPVEPGALVRRMCEDAQACSDPMNRKCKYINRLTPVFDTEKATENGINKVARTVLSSTFQLKDESTKHLDQSLRASDQVEPVPAYTYAIRHNIRNHTEFKSDEVIHKIANLIDGRHKVNLSSPDKVILVEIFQLFCGISVVDGKQWVALKRYNMSALYDLPVQGF